MTYQYDFKPDSFIKCCPTSSFGVWISVIGVLIKSKKRFKGGSDVIGIQVTNHYVGKHTGYFFV